MLLQKHYRRCPVAPILFFTFLLISLNMLGQNVSVNTLTGTANITIPIYNVKVGSLSAPVGLAYAATGLKVDNYMGQAGVGWNVIAGGSITRELRGFPDDIEYQGNSSYSSIKGWLIGGVASSVQSLSITNDNAASTCSDEITDAAAVLTTFPDNYDTEPDVFHVSAPGLNLSFIFDGSSTTSVKVIPYADVKITPSYDGSNRLDGFTIVNDRGIKYTFAKKVPTEYYIDNSNPIDPAKLEAFKRDYVFYREHDPDYGLLTYYDEWGLTEMEDPVQLDRILFNYGDYYFNNNVPISQYTQQEVAIWQSDGSGGFTKTYLYTLAKPRGIIKPTIIRTSVKNDDVITLVNEVQLSWDGAYAEGELTGIELPVQKTRYWPQYTQYTNTSWNSWKWNFMKALRINKVYCEAEDTRYDFSYYDVDFAAHTCYCISSIADSIKNGVDYWGYFNGQVTNPTRLPALWVYPDNSSLSEIYKINQIPSYSSGTEVLIPSNSDRSIRNIASVTTNNPRSGTLKRITNPAGGATEFQYENNRYFDVDVNDAVLGGGIRITKMTSNDGLNNVEETNYSYEDGNGMTTGRAVSVPKFAFVYPNSGSYSTLTDQVIGTTYLTERDLNENSEEIIYGMVTVQKDNAGKTVYEYNTEGTFGSGSVTNWDETINWVAREYLDPMAACTGIDPAFLTNGKLQYPFAPNSNFDFQRGLLNKVSHYNENGDLVASEENTYSLSQSSPDVVYGLKYDRLGGGQVVAYAKYGINTGIDNLLTTKVSKVFNSTSPSSSAYTAETQTFEYGSSYHKLLTKATTQNSDGSSMINRFQYIKDYPAATGSGDKMDIAVYNLQQLNNNALVEKAQSKLEGSTEKTVAASLTTFGSYPRDPFWGGSMYMPAESYEFVNQAGVTTFSFSDISSGTFGKSSLYTNQPVTITEYNYSGVPKAIVDNKRRPSTIITYDLSELKIAEFANAAPEHVAFSNFDLVNPAFGFTGTNVTGLAGGRASMYCLNFQTNTSLTKTIYNNGNYCKNIIVSIWLKDGATISGTPAISIDVAGTTYSIPFNSGDTKWTYYRAVIPNPLPVSTYTGFTVTLTTNAAVKADDLLIYPENATPTTYTYNSGTLGTYLFTAQTGANGVCKYFEYDYAGRPWLVRDQYENILEMKKYLLPNKWTAASALTVSMGISSNPAQVNTAVSLSAAIAGQTFQCPMGTNSYVWDFGDGSSTVTTTTEYVSHTYTSTGIYQASVTILVPGYGAITGQTPSISSTTAMPITIIYTPPPPSGGGGTPVICAAGIIQRTSSGTCIQSTCTSLSGSCSLTQFGVTSVTGGSLATIQSVEWQIADYGGSNWTYYSTGSSNTYGWQTSHPFHVVHTGSYSMRAKITYYDASVAYSNTINVLNGD